MLKLIINNFIINLYYYITVVYDVLSNQIKIAPIHDLTDYIHHSMAQKIERNWEILGAFLKSREAPTI